LIFFVYPGPKGSEENQFTLRRLAEWGKFIDFQAICNFSFMIADSHTKLYFYQLFINNE